MAEFKYVRWTTVKAYTKSSGGKVILELLWGDRVEILSQPYNGRQKVRARWAKWIYVDPDSLGDQPLLELYFIDVGQGDGILLVTPDRKHVLIDGGYNRKKQPHRKSAADFVDWKFFEEYGMDTVELDAMIASHCDADHYGGLWDLLSKKEEDRAELDTRETKVEKFYHAGVSWWKSDEKSRFLGREEDGRLLDLLKGRMSVADGLKSSSDLRLQGEWKEFLECVYDSGAAIERLAYNPEKAFDYLTDFGPDDDVQIKVLGPIEETYDGKPTLKDLGGKSTNTNGNSLVLRVDYGRSRILLTGDLNKKSQQHILESLAGNTQELAADVTKSCHHGSDDCSYSFLQYVRAAATIISSGDDETHAHPRPNIVAASGASGYAHIEKDEMITPLIYSTEISRSYRLAEPYQVDQEQHESDLGVVDISLKDMEKTSVCYKHTKSGALNGSKRSKFMNETLVVDGIVYGLVNVRTDGNRIVCATLNEGKSKWDIKEFNSRF